MAKAPKVANKDARTWVINKRPFRGSNTFGRLINYINARDRDEVSLYVVYSYGQHWPLFIYDFNVNQWFSNCDRYSVSTSKHHSQLTPYEATIPLTVEQMRLLVESGGYAQMTQRRLTA